MADRRKKKSSFGRFLFLYTVFGLFLVTCTFRSPISDVLRTYEDTRPETYMDRYTEHFDSERIDGIAQRGGLEYDANVFTAEDAKAIFSSAYTEKQGLTYRRNGALCTENRNGYHILDNGRKIGTVIIEQENKPYVDTWFTHKQLSGVLSKIFGCSFGEWSIVSENYSLEQIEKETVSVKVPENWTVSWNGYTLDESYRTGAKEHIADVDELYDYIDLPQVVTYSVTSYPGYIDLKVFDETGTPVTLGTEEENQAMFARQFEDNENESVPVFVNDFMDKYIRYCSGANKNRSGNLNSLLTVVVPNSDLEERMKLAYEGQYFASSRGDVIDSIDYNRIVVTDDHWLADITYVLSTTGNNGTVTTEHNAIVFMTEYNGRLMADMFISY